MLVDLVFLAAGIIFVGLLVAMGRRNRDKAWEQFASELGGEFVPGRFLRSGTIEKRAGQSVVTIDTYSVPSGDSSTSYTRLRAAFQNSDGLQFTIQRKGLIGRLDKALGMPHIEMGDEALDRDFVIQGNNEPKVRSLLADPGLCRSIQSQRSIELVAKDNELRLEVTGVVKDIDRLKELYKLFADVLGRVGG